MTEKVHCIDSLIIGGGRAGLTAATHLARFHRHIVLADSDQSRALASGKPTLPRISMEGGLRHESADLNA